MRKMGRHACLKRCLDMIRVMVDNRFGVTLPRLQEELEVSRREVYRYIQALREAGLHLENVSGGRGGRNKAVYKLINRQEWVAMRAIL